MHIRLHRSLSILFFSLATVFLLSFGLTDNAFADTPTENSATVSFDATTGTATMSWDFGTHTARDSCILKTETHQFPLKLANGDDVDPADPLVLNSTLTTFLGTNTSTVYSNGMEFETILADSTRLTDSTIPCIGNLIYTIPDRFIDNDIQLFATFAEIINPGDITSHDLGDYKLVDTVDEETKNTTNNLNALHEISIQYSDYIEFAPVQCGGANAWEIGTEYFKDIYTEDTIIELQPKLICSQNSDGESTNPDGTTVETTTTASSVLPTTGTWYLLYPITTSDSGGCDDCIDPTFYYSQNKNIVKDGFRYNDFSTNVTGNLHTDIPLLFTYTNNTNFLTLKVYDNFGTSAIKWIDVAFGSSGQHASFDAAEVRVEAEFSNNKIIDFDVFPEGQDLIHFGNATSSIVDCGYFGTANCLQITIPHKFNDELVYRGIVIIAEDQSGNKKSHYLNDGIQILGESLNVPPTDKIFIQKYLGGPQSEWVDILRIDRVDNVWISEDGIEFKGTDGGGFQRITPLDFDDTLID